MTSPAPHEPSPNEAQRTIRRHLILGWGGLCFFIIFGVVLEGLHAFKSPLYLDVENETRRFLFRLAHAHGALLSIVQFGVAATIAWLKDRSAEARTPFISLCFVASLLLLPGGFFLAGLGAVSGDPGWGIALVPGGALFLLAGAAALFRAVLYSK